MQRAAIYARVSSERQEQEQTIQSQLASLRRYADEQGFYTNSALTYSDDGFSGTHLDRPALDELRDHAREGRFDVVVVLCPDRLARKYAYQVVLLEEFQRARVEVHFCERPISDSPDDQLLLQIQGAIAEYERVKILERSRRGRLHRARMGELGPSRPPYGYRYAARRHGGDGQIRIHEEEAAMVRQIFAWYAEEGATLYSTLQKLNRSPWKPRAGGKLWSGATVLRMLHCEWYIGTAYYNRTKNRRNDQSVSNYPARKPPRRIVTLRPKDEWIAVSVPALIDDTQFARVQERIQENRRFAKRRQKREGVFLLKGLLKCGRCGHAYIGETHVETRSNCTEYQYQYYLCGLRMAPLPHAVGTRCQNKRLRAAGVDEIVWTTVRDLLLDSDALAKELAAWVDRATTQSQQPDGRISQTEMRLKELTRQRDRLTDAYQFGTLDLEAFHERINAIEKHRLEAQHTLAHIRAEQSEVETVKNHAAGVKSMVDQLKPSLLNANFETKQTILRLLIERVIVNNQQLEIHLALPVSGNFGLTSNDVNNGHACRLLRGGRGFYVAALA